jgi:hypothetical protein
LDEVFGFGGISQDANSDASSQARVALKERSESFAVTGADLTEERFVGGVCRSERRRRSSHYISCAF